MSGGNLRKMDLTSFMSSMEEIVSSDLLAAVFAMADEECARKIILHFRISGCKPLSEANLLIMYAPYADIAEPLRLEIKINPDNVLVCEFMNSQYSKLVELGAQVAISKNGVYVAFKVPGRGNIVRFIRETLDKVCNIFSRNGSNEKPNLTYNGFTLVNENG